jgi:peptidyl-prolyl cis-trans isomerase C
MKTKIKLIFSATLAAVLLALPQTQAATPPPAAAPAVAGTNANPADAMTALFGDPVIVKGKGIEIKRSELDEVMIGLKSAAEAHGQAIPPEQLPAIQSQMLNRLIQIQLLLQKATDADKADGKKKADEQIAALLKKAGSQEAMDRELKAVGMTLDELRAKVTQEATATAALQRELNVTVTDDEVNQFYTNNPTDFERPEQVHVRHILLMTIDPSTQPPTPLPDAQIQAKKKQIDDILKQLRGGADFAKLAMQYSEDPGSKDNGGELPPFGRGEMVPQFEAAAFTLNTNQISDVVTTSYGFHIIQLLDKTPAKKLALTDKVPLTDMTIADKIKDFLTQQKTGKLAPAYLDTLKKAAGVEILDADLKAAVDAAAAAAASAPAEMPGAGN